MGPSVALRGSSALGNAAGVGYSFSQSVLFTSMNHAAEWARRNPFQTDIDVRTAISSRAAVPVTDLRGTLSFDLGEHVSIGALGFVSIWYSVPSALELSLPFEKWEEPQRTIVFASIGPFVTVRF